MKALLGCLLLLVLTMSQAFAISGGPFGPGGQVTVTGVYAGVLKHPTDTPPAPPEPSPCASPPAGCSANSLGVFSVGVPKTGLATGTFVMFSQGRVFTGTLRGAADPGKAKLTAVLNATFDFTVTDLSTGNTASVTASANGSLKATISNVRPQNLFGATETRLSGNATLNIDQGLVSSSNNEPCVTCFMTLRVTGFKQSDTAPTTTSTG